jgi:hypothetical protein
VALNSTNNGKIFVKPSQALGQDTTFAAPYNSNKVAPTQRAIGTYARKIVKDTASALRTAINTKGSGTVTSIQLVGGTNVTITPTTAITTSGTYTISATGGSSTIVKANEFNMLYKANGDTTIRGTTKVRVDTTDLRMEFAFDTTTTAVTTDPHGGVKIWGSNRMGMGAVRINDTVSIPAALQRAINTQITSTLMPNTTLITGAAATGNYSIDGPVSIMTGASTLNVLGAYNSTIQHLNYTKLVITTSTAANQTVGIRNNSTLKPLGLICGNTKFSGGGGRGTFTASFPTYNVGQRIFIGYNTVVGAPLTDPTTFLGANNGLGVGKDATDTTLQFFNSNSVNVPIKVNTGVTPNTEDVYRVTVYVAPNSTYYIQLEVISKSAPIRVITYNPTTFVPPVSAKIYPMQYINNAATGVAIQYGFIYATEEIY